MAYRETPMTPIILSTGFSTLVGVGSTVIPDMGNMASSLYRRPMLVDEIRWSYYFPNYNSRIIWGSYLRCRLTLGRIALTGTRDGGGYVPIWAFGPALQLDRMVDDNTDSILGQHSANGSFRWKLPKPLFVAADQVLVPSFTRVATKEAVDNSTVYVAMSIVGRQYGDAECPHPSTLDVPYVCYYEPPPSVTAAISSELDLSNPFLVPYHVQRIVCRQPIQDNGSETYEQKQGSVNNLVAMKDSYGDNVVRDPSPISQVFDYNYRAWTFNRVLGPKERHVVQIVKLADDTTHDPAAAALQLPPNFAMVGYRQEGFNA